MSSFTIRFPPGTPASSGQNLEILRRSIALPIALAILGCCWIPIFPPPPFPEPAIIQSVKVESNLGDDFERSIDTSDEIAELMEFLRSLEGRWSPLPEIYGGSYTVTFESDSDTADPNYVIWLQEDQIAVRTTGFAKTWDMRRHVLTETQRQRLWEILGIPEERD